MKLYKKGFRTVKSNLGRMERGIIQETKSSLHQEMVTIVRNALPITPLRTSALRRSAQVPQPTQYGNKIKSVGLFGNSEVEYARTVHEGVRMHFRWPGTGAKYLQRPFTSAQPGMEGRIANRLEQRIKRGP